MTTVPNRGPVVTELTVLDAKALLEVRSALEGLAGALFAERATAGRREQLGGWSGGSHSPTARLIWPSG
ncbi:DNA-binding GntR family transcriptional regulator [Streptomyces aurantiacus]|nr:DNA-binding GntR family transcriptional regulator [Streptomyces aurantiacus]